MSTRYRCSRCGWSLAQCRCESPVPAVDGEPVRLASRPWTREEVLKLLSDEVAQQQAEGRARVADHRAQRRRRD